MQRNFECSVPAKMEELRLVCEREIPIQQSKINSYLSSFKKTLDSTKATARQTLNNREKIGKLKAELREVEDDLVKALAAKTRKEAERMAIMDSVSSARTRNEELKRIVEDQKARKNEYAEIMSRQYESLSACEQNSNKNERDIREIEEAMSWYNKILGFRIECGRGVKYIFTNIDSKNPNAEYSFCVRHQNNMYTLLECDPPLKDIEKEMHELNKSNGLFKFVRTMREKFQEATACGNFPQITSRDQVASSISLSAPASSVSTESRTETILSTNKLQPEETNRSPKKMKHGSVGKVALLSPGSASSFRRSARFKVKK